jgi:hypothetical protein
MMEVLKNSWEKRKYVLASTWAYLKPAGFE